MTKIVFIIRGSQTETFTGLVIGESSTHYKIVHTFRAGHASDQIGEWFAKKSKNVFCV